MYIIYTNTDSDGGFKNSFDLFGDFLKSIMLCVYKANYELEYTYFRFT